VYRGLERRVWCPVLVLLFIVVIDEDNGDADLPSTLTI
jgi:hypothetical protein